MVWHGQVFTVLALVPLVLCTDFFEDDSLEDVDFTTMFSQKCEFKCKNGAKPTENKGHKYKPKTCGTLGKKYGFLKDIADVTSCCDQLHLCYETCNKKKSQCDQSFNSCLKDMCDNNFEQADKEGANACTQATMLMYTSVIGLGCDTYIVGQKNACLCKHRQNSDIVYEEL